MYFNGDEELPDMEASARETMHHVGCGLRKVKKWSRCLAASYLVMKLYNARNTKLSEIDTALENHIHTKPVESAIISLGVGYLIGKWFR